MNYKIIKAIEVKEDRHENIKAKQLLNEQDIGNISIALVKLTGKNKRVINMESDGIYYILHGEGYFTLNNEIFFVKEGDLVFIPKGTTYQDEGTMEMLVINNPRFEMKQVKFLD